MLIKMNPAHDTLEERQAEIAAANAASDEHREWAMRRAYETTPQALAASARDADRDATIAALHTRAATEPRLVDRLQAELELSEHRFAAAHADFEAAKVAVVQASDRERPRLARDREAARLELEILGDALEDVRRRHAAALEQAEGEAFKQLEARAEGLEAATSDAGYLARTKLLRSRAAKLAKEVIALQGEFTAAAHAHNADLNELRTLAPRLSRVSPARQSMLPEDVIVMLESK